MGNSIKVLIFCLTALLFSCGMVGADNEPLNDGPVAELKEWLAQAVDQRAPLESLDFSTSALSITQADSAMVLLLADKQASLMSEFDQQWNNRVLLLDGKSMPFFYQLWGDEPADGRSLFISMHGGGGAPASVNDQQWENQKHLYDQTMKGLEGMYLAPRAPTNTWNLWHQDHIDDLFSVLIQMAVIKENVNPNKVYLMGYSAGGDGVFQLAPRMADSWAAASMMAGHPNETSPVGLKNTPFALHMGALDDSYNRNGKAQEWQNLLDSLEQDAPGTYIHDVQIHEGMGHWMQLKDAVALPWMQQFTRNPTPQSVVWKQDDVHHSNFYWLGVPAAFIETGAEVRAEYHPAGNEINIIDNYSPELQLLINDVMMDLDAPVTIKYQGSTIHKGILTRTILTIYESLAVSGDQNLAFPCMITVIDNEQVIE